MKIEFYNYEESNEKIFIKNSKAVLKKNFTEDGIFSKEIFGDMKNISYQCSCGQLKGKFLLNNECPSCKTKVNKIDSVTRVAYIDLEDYYVIFPIFYYFLEKVMPLNKIINFNLDIDENGEKITEKRFEWEKIGLIEFKNKFDTILDFYEEKYSKNKEKTNIINFIRSNRENIFTNKILVYNLRLRPVLLINQNLVYDEVNKFYTLILNTLDTIKEKKEKTDIIFPLLYKIQEYYIEISNYIIEEISTKTGIIRNNLLGFRSNFSSRSIITPGDVPIDSIILPYLGAVELFKFSIINILTKIGFKDPLSKFYLATQKFDGEVYEILKEIHSKYSILLNRNPTISFGSILKLKIKEIKKEYNDFTISINNNILKMLAGDYDGDVLNVILIIDNELKDFFEPFSPKNLCISNDNGLFDRRLLPARDNILGIYSLFN